MFRDKFHQVIVRGSTIRGLDDLTTAFRHEKQNKDGSHSHQFHYCINLTKPAPTHHLQILRGLLADSPVAEFSITPDETYYKAIQWPRMIFFVYGSKSTVKTFEENFYIKRYARNIPEGSTDILTVENITDGMRMVDIPRLNAPDASGKRTNYNFGEYYINTPHIRALTHHPSTRTLLRPENVVHYKARIVPRAGGGRRSLRRNGRKHPRNHTARRITPGYVNGAGL